jgi:sulfatase maturation enzyme AslB (radical SAM superfamily)
LSLFLEVTTAMPAHGCPVDCRFCPQVAAIKGYGETAPRLMSLQTFVACLAKMPAGTAVGFSGYTEPFVNRQTVAMAEHCHAQGIVWEVYSTAVGLDLADVERLRAAKPKRIKIHLPDVEGYAKIRVDDAYVKVVEALADIPNTAWMTMGTLHPAMLPRFGKTPADWMHSRAGNIGAEFVKLQVPRKKGPIKCRPGPELDRNVLLPNANLAVCCHDFGQRHVIGNLLTQSWQEIRDGEPLAALRAAMAAEDSEILCRTCEFSVPAGEKIKCA